MNEAVATLHRHYVWADRMRVHFEQEILQSERDDFETRMYMSLWYGFLYGVVEGWRNLRIIDEHVDILLQSPNLDRLRLYRNAVFHPQSEYWSPKSMAFLASADSVSWVRELHTAIGDYLLKLMNTGPSETQ